MDPLTHVFLPLLVAYVLRPDLFPDYRYLLLGGFGVIPDLDKLIGIPGLLHSLVTLVPLCVVLIAADYWYRGDSTYGLLASAFLLSHLLLDIIEGVPVTLLYPFVTTGVGLAYPMEVVFGTGPLGFTFQNPPIALEFSETRTGYAESDAVEANTFGFIDEYGVTSTITFVVVYLAECRR